jgi:hypothetical protein
MIGVNEDGLSGNKRERNVDGTAGGNRDSLTGLLASRRIE